MKILVLLAGVLDPKWPIVRSVIGLPERSADRLILSPFDEAALELALKIRDAEPDVSVRALIAGGAAATKLARAVSAFNLTAVATFNLSAMWDQALVARELAGICRDFDLILIGREFGDCDDGLVPPMLAGRLGCGYFGRVQALEPTQRRQLLRETVANQECLEIAGQLVASVTNDRRTRLRKPLMKNVMMARQATITHIESIAPQVVGVEFVSTHELVGTRDAVHCTLIAGSARDQAEQLAALLMEPLP